ncbi:recombination mediator RecR [Alteromonas sp. a30]|uniref:recombination mediator RecR n=1 Tax=Alteromonas sp. a30 TaxID=2730917 RepID=UPI0022824BA2|nr:recombination mediator RecR [Alteromonas sp. a30]MCY7297315.1 recombination protein RecR [Alteromonas sp. a30]
MKFSPLIDELISDLKCLPGVGAKSAQRMAFQLLERNRDAALKLSRSLHDAMEHVKHCEQCRNFTETSLCDICQNPRRGENGILCVVETPQDVLAIEQASEFKGRYFVLMGHLSPIDGVGPDEIGIPALQALLQKGEVNEVILATNFTVEGEATAHFISDICKSFEIKASRIARGVPMGGELEYIDGSTLSHAFQGRQQL